MSKTQPIDHVSHIPFCPDRGFAPGVSDKGKDKYTRAAIAQQMSDAEWLAESKPFVPRELDQFRKSQCVTNLGDYLPEAAE